MKYCGFFGSLTDNIRYIKRQPLRNKRSNFPKKTDHRVKNNVTEK